MLFGSLPEAVLPSVAPCADVSVDSLEAALPSVAPCADVSVDSLEAALPSVAPCADVSDGTPVEGSAEDPCLSSGVQSALNQNLPGSVRDNNKPALAASTTIPNTTGP